MNTDLKALFAKYWWAFPILLIVMFFFFRKKRRRSQRRRNGRFVSMRRGRRRASAMRVRSSAKSRKGTKAYWKKWAAKMKRARNRKKRRA